MCCPVLHVPSSGQVDAVVVSEGSGVQEWGRGQHWGEQEALEAPGVMAGLLGQRRNRRL